MNYPFGAIIYNVDESEIISRISYVQRIIQKIDSSPSLFVTPNQERLYNDAVQHLAAALSFSSNRGI